MHCLHCPFLSLAFLLNTFSTPNTSKLKSIMILWQKKYQPLNAGLDENNNQVENSDVEDNFDGKGLANYLAPYALALGLSIAVTVAFVKFVLMDY
mmetsp:Transcript_213/g.533  ORF Transcript_213/g.533 Transcript_213/m.533 type:complete len:95 (-) Transcript_213:153-437(-)